MAKAKVSNADLAHQVVREATEPLSVPEIVARVNAISPITTKNPKNTIRGAISQSRLIVSLGDGRYGWKPRVLSGAVLRLTLSAEDLAGPAIALTSELWDALWPAFFEIQKRSDREPVQMVLPDDQVTSFPLTFLGEGRWGSEGGPAFWAWFEGLGAVVGDQLIFTVLDGEARQYALRFERRAERDEAAIAARNQALSQAVIAFVGGRWQGTASWDVTTHLLVRGYYHHPLAPDPLAEIWPESVVNPFRDHYQRVMIREREPEADPGLSALFGRPTQVYDYEHPPDLPPEYDSRRGMRRPRVSRQGLKGAVKTFTLRVNHRALPQVWRDIELAEDQTLEDLHLMIQQAFAWGDDHLYSFFLSGEAWDQETEVGSPWSDSSLHTHQVQLGQLDLELGQRFLYFFDYGDSHEFDVQVLAIIPAGRAGRYPRLVGAKGEAPPQYPDYDEETGEPDWDAHAHYG